MLRLGIAAAAIAVAATATSIAQENEFSFGPPLRSDHIFGYKYIERVSVVQEIDGAVTDSNERVVTYYITQRQILPKSKGPMTIRVNIDSMTLDYRGMDERITFNTQQFVEGDWKNAHHREVLAPSSLVNRVITARVSPYGELLELKSEDIDGIRKQTEDPAVDEFTRLRIAESTTNEYLSSILFPWRTLPLGRKVKYDQPVSVPMLMAFDHLSFRTTGTARLMKSPTGEPVVRFEGTLTKPVLNKMSVPAYSDPLAVKSVDAAVAGELTVEEDGVVRSGWTSITGTVKSDRNGAAVTSRIRHEVYIEPLGIAPYTSN